MAARLVITIITLICSTTHFDIVNASYDLYSLLAEATFLHSGTVTASDNYNFQVRSEIYMYP